MTNRIEIEKLRYWCHKILPLVYDDSLSYYELLCRVTAKINEIIEAIGDLPSGKHIVDSEDITVEEVENEIKLYLANQQKPLVDSEQIVVSADDDNTKLYLQTTVSNKLDRALLTPIDHPATKKMVVINTDGSQGLENLPSANGLYRHAIEFTPAMGVFTKFSFVNDKASEYTAYNALRDAMSGQYITGLYEASATKKGVTIYVSDDGTKIMKLDGTTEEEISGSFFDTVTAI